MTEGFAAVPNWMIRDTTFGLNEILVYIALASHSGPGGIHPSQAILCAESRLSESSVRRALRRLEERGVIGTVPRSSRVGRLSNAYLLYPNGPDLQPVPVTGSALQPVSGTGATGQGEQSALYIEEEPIKNISDRFDEFWKLYPRHVGKTAAKGAFNKALKAGVDVEAILEGVRRFAEDPNLPEPRFIPHPTTWLHQGRWEDEPLPQLVGAGAPVRDDGFEDWMMR